MSERLRVNEWYLERVSEWKKENEQVGGGRVSVGEREGE